MTVGTEAVVVMEPVTFLLFDGLRLQCYMNETLFDINFTHPPIYSVVCQRRMF